MQNRTPASVQEYVQIFEQEFEIDVRSQIRIVSINSGDKIGRCWLNDGPNSLVNLIELDEKFWNNADYWSREQLVFHELAHCEFGILEHDDSLTEVETTFGGLLIKASIMHHSHIPSIIYKNFRDHYIEELKGKRRKTLNRMNEKHIEK